MMELVSEYLYARFESSYLYFVNLIRLMDRLHVGIRRLRLIERTRQSCVRSLISFGDEGRIPRSPRVSTVKVDPCHPAVNISYAPKTDSILVSNARCCG